MQEYQCPLCESPKTARGLHGHLSLGHQIQPDLALELSRVYRQAIDSADLDAIMSAEQRMRDATQETGAPGPEATSGSERANPAEPESPEEVGSESREKRSWGWVEVALPVLVAVGAVGLLSILSQQRKSEESVVFGPPSSF